MGVIIVVLVVIFFLILVVIIFVFVFKVCKVYKRDNIFYECFYDEIIEYNFDGSIVVSN